MLHGSDNHNYIVTFYYVIAFNLFLKDTTLTIFIVRFRGIGVLNVNTCKEREA